MECGQKTGCGRGVKLPEVGTSWNFHFEEGIWVWPAILTWTHRNRLVEQLIDVCYQSNAAMKRIIGTRDFTDGTQRRIHEDDDGRQFVIDDDSQAVYGMWLLPDEPAAIVECAAGRSPS